MKYSALLLSISSMLLIGCTGRVSHQPLPNAANRATPLSFGMYVTPNEDQNPIDPPERFSGYHAALDYEVSEGEVDGDVPVYAICSGKVLFSGYVEGYGGTVVHRCIVKGDHATVLYGHLSLSGLPKEGSTVTGGQTIGLLGAPRSLDSGYNRKHLHLGIHKGKNLAVAGYVQTEEKLDAYVDPADVLSSLAIDLPGQSAGETPYWEKEDEDKEDKD